MIRTSIVLPAPLYQRLSLLAKQDGKKLSELVRDLLDRSIAEQEQRQTARMYQVLKEMDGIVKSNITDASSTIDEVLYGEQGAWRGTQYSGNEK
jgi:predicted DNA-binding protein